MGVNDSFFRRLHKLEKKRKPKEEPQPANTPSLGDVKREADTLLDREYKHAAYKDEYPDYDVHFDDAIYGETLREHRARIRTMTRASITAQETAYRRLGIRMKPEATAINEELERLLQEEEALEAGEN